MKDDTIDLDILHPDHTYNTCVVECGSRCCNFEDNDFTVKLSVGDYQRLFENGLHHLVTFVYKSRAPQLVNQLNGNCVFLSNRGKGCTIHHIRPKICRLYPFASDNIADWCLLYHNASKEQQQQLAEELEEDRYLNTSTTGRTDEASQCYEKYRQEGDSFVREQVQSVATLDGANEYWMVFLGKDSEIQLARELIDRLKREEQTTPWRIYSIRHHAHDMKLLYQLIGVTRRDFQVDIPYIDTFPPDQDDLFQLIQMIEFDPQWREYMTAGIEISEEFRDDLMSTYQNQNQPRS